MFAITCRYYYYDKYLLPQIFYEIVDGLSGDNY